MMGKGGGGDLYRGVGVGNDMGIISEFVLFFTCAFVSCFSCLLSLFLGL